MEDAKAPYVTRVLLAGGGTAGHVEPALAVADALRRRHPGMDVLFLGTASGLEATLVPTRGYELALIPRVPLPRRLSKDVLTLPFRMAKAVRHIRRLIQQRDIDVVVGFGGYVALPAYLAARGKVPVVIHEANARPGLANKVGARWAQVVCEAVSGSLSDAVHVGVPLRRSISHMSAVERADARRRLGLDPTLLTVLVIGGSQGARAINRAMRDAAQSLLDANVQVLHAVGKLNEDDLLVLNSFGDRYKAVPYIDDMASAYASADLVICRAGAMTCAEVAAVGIPAMFVPYPVGNGEQKLNALPLVNAGAATLVEDAQLSGRVITEWVSTLVKDSARRADMTRAMTALGMRDADERIVDIIDAILGAEGVTT